MQTSNDFIRQSLETHLFFARIMKEHSFFLEVAFTPRDGNFTNTADEFRLEFDKLLAEVISLSNGVVSQEALNTGDIITQYTLNAELAASFFTGVRIQTQLTQAEAGLQGGLTSPNMLERRVYMLNQRAIELIDALIQFKTRILSNVLTCKMFTYNYPLLIDHILREARFYMSLIQRLQNREQINLKREEFEQQAFWNRIMAEHAKFIRGLLDPSENELFNTANDFGNQFDRLTMEALQAMDQSSRSSRLTENTIPATRNIRDFKAQATQGLLECKIKSITVPLLGDHVLREANHYLHLLETFASEKFV